MRHARVAGCVAALVAAALAGCGRGPIVPDAPAPPACGLAEFALAPGITLPPPKSRAPVREKSRPLQYADAIPVQAGVGVTGKWADAAPGWKAWRTWFRSDEARSLAVHVKPLALPPHATLWLCSPDRTIRRAVEAQAMTGRAEYWSPAVPGFELWLEVQVPAGAEGDVTLIVAEVFAATQ